MALKNWIKDKVGDYGSFATLGILQNSKELKAEEKRKQAKDMLNNSPTYERPEEISQIVNMWKDLSSQQRMPGYGQQQQQIANSAAQATENMQEAAATSGAALGGLSDIYRKELAAMSQLNQQSDMYMQQQRQNYGSALGVAANYTDKEYQYNELDPYMRNYQSTLNDADRYYQQGQQQRNQMYDIAGSLIGFGIQNKAMNNAMPNYGQPQQPTWNPNMQGMNIAPQYNYGMGQPQYMNPYQTWNINQ